MANINLEKGTSRTTVRQHKRSTPSGKTTVVRHKRRLSDQQKSVKTLRPENKTNYKGYTITYKDGLYQVVYPDGTVFTPSLDDSKMSGSRSIDPETNTMARTKAFIDDQVMFKDVQERGYMNERELLLFKRRLNDGKTQPQNLNYFKSFRETEGLALSPEQNKKGLDYLRDQWRTPSGIERKNNPFGARETEVLENAKEIRLLDFNNKSTTPNFNNYVPIYQVVAKDGSTFDYYVQGGRINIVG
jgi:hypothetical protein